MWWARVPKLADMQLVGVELEPTHPGICDKGDLHSPGT